MVLDLFLRNFLFRGTQVEGEPRTWKGANM